MKRHLITILTLGGAALIFAADSPKKDSNDLQALRKRIDSLELRVAELEAKALSGRPGSILQFPSLPRGEGGLVPPNKGEIEINGLKVYKVPLASK